MRRHPLHRFGSCLFLGLLLGLVPLGAFATPQPASASSADSATHPLTVGVKAAPPFVVDDGNGKYSGLAIDLWQQVANDHGWTFTYKPYDLKGLLAAVGEGKVDVGLGAITTTARREQSMDFSHPITSSGLGVAVRNEQQSGWLSVAQALVSPAFLKIIGLLVVLLLVVGSLVWLFEHKDNEEQFGGSKSQGIFSGFWWAMVTMTTVGYGDTAPRSVPGRILGLIWMLTALIVVSFFTASITSALTVGKLSQRIAGAGDLAHMHVASVSSSTSAEWLTEQHIDYVRTDSLDAALADLASGKVDAVVYDKPLLRWDIHHQYRGRLDVLPLVLERQDYAFALPRHSPLREAINTSMLKRINSSAWPALIKSYLGKAP